MREAAIYGYEVNMLERVSKVKRPTTKKKRGSGNGYATTSGQSSGSEAPFYGVPSVAEQAVDELLQMKLLESMFDFLWISMDYRVSPVLSTLGLLRCAASWTPTFRNHYCCVSTLICI